MTRFVAQALAAGGRAAAERRLFLRFSLLTDQLAARPPFGPELAGDLDASLRPLEAFGARELADHATPFFQMAVHRLFEETPSSGDDAARMVRDLQLLAFDAFFEHMPDGPFAEVPPGHDLALPALGVYLAGDARPRTLGKRRDDLIIGTGGDEVSFPHGRVPAEFALPAIRLRRHPRSTLLLSSARMLFEDDYRSEVAPEPHDANALASMLDDALSLIEHVDVDLGKALTDLVEYYVPIRTPDRNTTHNSFSVARQIGVIFLSESYHDIRLVEAVVHEYLHNELNLLMGAQPLFDDDREAIYYSPWRTDPRPISGLYHACYVFSTIVGFYERAAALDDLTTYGPLFQQRRIELAHQLRYGLVQIPGDRLTTLGAAVRDSMLESVAATWASFRIGEGSVPSAVEAHLTRWQSDHPSLAGSFRHPQDRRLSLVQEGA